MTNTRMKKDGLLLRFNVAGMVLAEEEEEEEEEARIVVSLLDVTERKRAEEEIQSLARFQSENPNPILRIARDGTLLYINQTGLSLLPEWHLQVGQAAPPMLREAALQSMNNETTQALDLEHGERVYSFFVAPVVAAGYANLYGRDITERKRAEEALRNSEGLLQKIFDILPVGLWFADKDGKLLRGNPAGVKIWGAEPEVGPSEYGVFKARRLPSGEEVAPHDWALAHTIRDRVTVVDELLEIDAFDGKKKTILNYTAPLLDAQGDVQGAIVVNQDITERKRAEEAERDQRQLAEALCETAAALNRTLDVEQVLDTILENAARVVPYDAGEVLLLSSGARVRDVRHRGYDERGLEEWAKSRDFPLSDFPILVRVAETRQPLVVPDTRDFPGWVDMPEARWIRSHICAPIIGKDHVTGFICLSSISPHMYGLEQARRLGAFADQAAVALENASLFAQVRTRREQMRVLSRRLLETQELERRRVARELHDEVGQLLTGLKLVLQMIAASAPDGQKRGLDEAESLVSELMARVRQLSLDLRPAMLDDLGLLPALLWHMPRYSQQTKVAVDFKHDGIEGRRFAPETETAAYRIVQEALTNVARHSDVTQACVRVWCDSEALTVQVEDQGAGFDADALLASGRTSGLDGMRERVALLDGQLTVESAPGQGTHLSAVLPLAEPARKRAAKP